MVRIYYILLLLSSVVRIFKKKILHHHHRKRNFHFPHQNDLNTAFILYPDGFESTLEWSLWCVLILLKW